MPKKKTAEPTASKAKPKEAPKPKGFRLSITLDIGFVLREPLDNVLARLEREVNAMHVNGTKKLLEYRQDPSWIKRDFKKADTPDFEIV